MKLFLVLLIVGGSMALPNSKIGASVISIMKSTGTANVFVLYKENTATVLDTFGSNSSDRQERAANVVASLKSIAETTQGPTINILDNLGFKDYQMFWITNQLYLKGVNLTILEFLLFLVGNIIKIEIERIIQIIRPINTGNALCPSGGTNPNNGTIQWGVNSVRAPEAWEVKNCSCYCDGNVCGEKNCKCQGQGVIVGVIDTGAFINHTDLTENYLGGKFAWKDFTKSVQSDKPYDDNGHGTHVTGTAAGRNGIGVAPGAKWISCKALDASGSGTQSALLGCGQFMICPSNPNTTTKCSGGADIVSNSWGGVQGSTWFDPVIRAWRRAGIIPVFAAGNSGPGCATVNSPADSGAGVVAVGACAENGTVANFSSRGPSNTTANPQATLQGKPGICAPGVNVRSASPKGNKCYQNLSGTSMATPHVAGCFAILLSYLKTTNWTFEQIVKYLFCSANQQRGNFCSNSKDYPNYYYGYGNMNCFAALQGAINGEPCDPPGW